jgi:hypothetical protein
MAILYPPNFSATHFCQRLSRSQDYTAAASTRPIEKSSYLIRNRTRDLPLVAHCLKQLLYQTHLLVKYLFIYSILFFQFTYPRPFDYLAEVTVFH